VQDDDFATQDETGASQAMENLRQSMLGQPGMAMAAQGNQLSDNVFSLLQPID
jgi:flagellin-like hook-associated protein FlgL